MNNSVFCFILPDEINLEDIWFLLWYYISMVRYDEIIVGPLFFEVSTLPEEAERLLYSPYISGRWMHYLAETLPFRAVESVL